MDIDDPPPGEAQLLQQGLKDVVVFMSIDPDMLTLRYSPVEAACSDPFYRVIRRDP